MEDTWEFLRLKIFRCLKPESQSPCQISKSVGPLAVLSQKVDPSPHFARLGFWLRSARSSSPGFAGLGKKALRAFFFSMAGLSIWAMYSLSPCPSVCIAFLYLPKGGFAPYWHLPPKCRQKKPPLFFAPIILRTSPRRGTADHHSAVRPAPRSPLLISRDRCPCGRVGA